MGIPDYIPPSEPAQEDPNAERRRHLATGIAGSYVAAPRIPTDYGNCLKCGLPMQVLDMMRGIQCPKCWV